MKSPVTVQIYDGKRTKVVHINRLQHRCVPGQHDTANLDSAEVESDYHEWTPSSLDHVILPPIKQTVSSRYPQRQKITRLVQTISLWSSLTGGGKCSVANLLFDNYIIIMIVV